MSRVLGFDTSNYTTSVAVFDGENGQNVGRLLDVPQGMLGLRQSEALFSHVKRLPDLMRQLQEAGLLDGISGIGASTQPREVEGSYMPCFLAGYSQARVLSAVLGVPFSPALTNRDIWLRQPGLLKGWSFWPSRFWPGICPEGRQSCCWYGRRSQCSCRAYWRHQRYFRGSVD